MTRLLAVLFSLNFLGGCANVQFHMPEVRIPQPEFVRTLPEPPPGFKYVHIKKADGFTYTCFDKNTDSCPYREEVVRLPTVTTTIGVVIYQPPIQEYPAWGYTKYRQGTWYRPRY